jgi:threonine/homoserine/homoserine lactone efflux protein
MTDPLLFFLAVLSLLLTPGPTNTHLATSGAAGGFGVAARLVPAELLGYTASTGLLASLLAALQSRGLYIQGGVRIATALYLLLLAWNLWRYSHVLDEGRLPIGPQQVFVTTLLNPKGLIMVTFLPISAGIAATAPYLLLLAVTIAACGCAWIAFGAFLRRHVLGPQAVRLLGRVGSVVLIGFATTLLVR